MDEANWSAILTKREAEGKFKKPPSTKFGYSAKDGKVRSGYVRKTKS